MTAKKPTHAPKRLEIINAADLLFYRKGYEKTSFADIAAVVNISRGNFYHHFKAKDEILAEVIDLRLERTRKILLKWETQNSDPEHRIRCFIRILINNQSKIMDSGCPVGTLTTELNKLEHVAKGAASQIFNLFRDWLSTQFILMGHKKNSLQYAMHVLALSQGVATLAQAYKDKKFIQREVDSMCAWLSNLDTTTP